MANELEGRPEEPVAEIDPFDLVRRDTAEDRPATPPERRRHGFIASAKHVFGCGGRMIAFSALGFVVLIVGALALAQGLTAALRSSWPVRVAGIAGPDDGNVGLSVETNIALAGKTADSSWKPELADSRKLADIRDFAQASGQSNGVRVVPDKRVQDRGYLPPEMRRDAPTSNTVITVPVSQGRLLRFDEPVELVFIADPTVADIRVVSPDLVYVYGKHAGRTNLMAVSNRPGGAEGGPKLAGSALLRVVWDEAAANEAKQILSPNAPADIFIFGHRAAVKGTARTIDQAVDLANVAQTYTPSDQPPINDLTLAGSNQINIRVRFAEVSRQDLRSFGIDWNIAVSAGGFQFGLARTGQADANNPSLQTTNGIGTSPIGKIGNVNLDVLVDALQRNGALTVLAEPNLTAVTGKTANFLAGGEIPIAVPVTGTQGAGTVPLVGFQYKTFGVSLDFTPTMIKQNRIAMTVKPEVSAIDPTNSFVSNGFNVPAFTVRRAETTVEVASGQTFAIAGLFQRNVTHSIDKMPGLGDVPVLGELFRSERYQRNETELVILITPYLVNPVSDQHLATPLDRMDTPAAWRPDGVDPTSKGAALTGPEAEKASGFILK